MPFEDDIRKLADLKQQISQKMILLVQHTARMSLTRSWNNVVGGVGRAQTVLTGVPTPQRHVISEV